MLTRRLLADEVREGADVRGTLFRSPRLPQALAPAVPAKYREAAGVSHLKVLVFDDDVVLTGANLSHDYFTNRQDRYVVLSGVPELADWYEEVMDAVADASHQLVADGSLRPPSRGAQAAARAALHVLVTNPGSKRGDVGAGAASDEETATWLGPTLQFGPWGLDHDARVALALLGGGMLRGRARIQLALAYMNLTPELADAVVAAAGRGECEGVRVVTAAPEANGFHGASGLPGYVPFVYSWLASEFYSKARQALAPMGADDKLVMYEYAAPGQTFHCKGVWVSEAGQTATLVGSTNYGARSADKDLESQVGIFTTDPEVAARLEAEAETLVARASRVSEATYSEPQRAWPGWLPVVAKRVSQFF